MFAGLQPPSVAGRGHRDEPSSPPDPAPSPRYLPSLRWKREISKSDLSFGH
ncbi:hypothetical protein DAI22_01g194500 [Oryza sativa Japonica Group]|nr:hypothetical protein DAI22_01g194500 [Oryza sativa Japonica Group]